MSKRHQTGYLFRKDAFWYVRFYDDVAQPDGHVVRRQVCRQVVAYSDRYRSKRDVRTLVEEMLKPLNNGRAVPQSVMTIRQFFEESYLPSAEQRNRPSTVKGYRDIWRCHLRARLGDMRLGDFRCSDGERLLGEIARQSNYGLSRTTLRRIKALLSGVFTYARRLGVFSEANPMQGISIPRGKEPEETYAYSLEEIMRMLAVLPNDARIVVATAAFTGLRRSELRGLRWEDYRVAEEGGFGEIRVSRSVWKSYIHATKTAKSKAPVPVIPLLARMLDDYRTKLGNLQKGPIFAGPKSGRPLNLDNLGHRVMEPILRMHGIDWRWWHPFRRGLATNLHRLEVPDKVIQAILRHASLLVTMTAYVKDVPAASIEAMHRLEEEIWNQYATSGKVLVS